MKIQISTLAILFLFTSLLPAQRPEWSGSGGTPTKRGPSTTGKITGTVLDSISKEAVEFATVVLIDSKTQKQKDGIVTEPDGSFKLMNVPTGTYELQISFIGYLNKTIKDIKLTPKSPDFDLGTVDLASESIELGAVEVTGEASAFENRIDKLVYDPEKDVTTAGGDASEVLARVPLLSIDSDGNVSLRGSSNVQILVNGKPSTLFSSNPGDALKTIPAEMIKNVEVITVPTAKYDGEGTGGIINIVMKKKNIEGFTGSINGSVGTRSNSGNVNLNLVRGRFGLNLNGGGWYGWPRPSGASFLRIDTLSDGQLRTLEQETEGDGNYYGPRLSLGAFYDFNAYNSINSSLTYRGFGRTSEDQTVAFRNDPSRDINEQFTRANESTNLRGGFDWTTDFTHTFKKPGQEFSVAIQVSGNNSNTENTIFQEGSADYLYQNEINENDGLNVETTLQADYIHPFSKAVKLETGVKSILRNINSDFTYRAFDPDQQQFILDRNRSDDFDYKQDVYAGYLSFNIKLGEKYGMVAGARYEYTDISGDFAFSESTFTNNYSNLLPSVILSRTINQFSAIRLSYTKRIQRPSLYYVNPFVQNSDPLNISQGNPELLPEDTDQMELAYNTYIKGVVVNASFFYRQTNDVIENIQTIEESGRSVTNFQNIGRNQSIGLNLFGSGTLKKILTIRGGVNLYSYDAEGVIQGRTVSNTAWIWGGNLNLTLSLPKNLKVEASGFYRSPQQTIQGFSASYRRIQFGARKEFWDKRASLGIVAAQPFSRTLRFPSEINGNGFYQESDRYFVSRSIGLSFSYRFGKLDFQQQRRQRRSRIENSDLKSGGDGGNY